MSEEAGGAGSAGEGREEWEEEEVLVYAELDESVNIHMYRSTHVLGVDTPHPVLQLDDNFYKGKYEHNLGTYMFFEEDPGAQTTDPLFNKLPDKNLVYVCKSNKLITTNPAYLTPKEGMEKEFLKKLELPEEPTVIEEFNNIEEALKQFESTYRKPECNSKSMEITGT